MRVGVSSSAKLSLYSTAATQALCIRQAGVAATAVAVPVALPVQRA